MNVESRVLAELSEERFNSGEAISARLNISRAAVWKHVARLRERGYNIEAYPRLGYRLRRRPDKLIAAELEPRLDTKVMGSRIVHHEEVTSTADVARKLIDKRAPEGTVVLAERQTAGRGRMGRSWETPAGTAIALSVVLYPPFPPSKMPLLSLATGVAAARAVESVCGSGVDLKWPNDIYMGGKKLGGVLVEMAGELDRVKWAIDSVGLNVNCDFSGGALEETATSLGRELGRSVSRLDTAAALINELDRVYAGVIASGFASVKREFGKRDLLGGLQVEVKIAGGTVAGVAAGIDDSGCLLVRDNNGATHHLSGGEATLS